MSSLMTTKTLSTSTLLLLLFMLLLPVATLLTTTDNDNDIHNNNIDINKDKQQLEQTSKVEQTTPHHALAEFKSTTTTTRSTTSLTFVKSRSRRQFDLKSSALHNEQKFSLPSVPLPPPPPFPSGTHNFGLNAFSGSSGSGSGSSSGRFPNAFAGNHAGTASSAATGAARCGGILKARYGIIQTPNFPHKFDTPIECVWVIDASELPSLGGQGGSGGGSYYSSSSSPVANTTIVVYLTQLYVLGGLKFTEYMYYSDDFKVPAHRVFTLTEDDVTQVAWVQFNSQYLEIRFTMQTLDGTHLRALDRLLDVYGFNITYEVQNEVKSYQCNTLQCRFLGNCYATEDFSSYACSCFSGFSGIDCGHGPLCEDAHTNVCQNGGTCKHIGDAAITCHCPPGYKGNKCEIPEINGTTLGCTSDSSSASCHRECEFEQPKDGYSMLKGSRSAARTGKTRYEVTIRLGTNLTAFYRHAETERRGNDQLPSLLEKHLARVLRNFNVTRVNDLELISNNTDRLDITFHFFGIKGDSSRIREAITRMVERGRIGNITLVSNYHHFDENPPLNLMELTVNQQPAVREDSEFIISCTAQGSSRMQFQWYKDGAIVNASRATREIWTTVLPPENKDVFTAILGVTKASNIDEGVYTCKVTDWGVEQCRSIHIHVKSPPHLRVDPASVTLERGDSLRVRCLSPGNDDIKRYAQLGYSWTRNGVLFQSASSTAMWEDLYPDGSILKINNIQKSAEYACLVSNTVKPVLKSVYINVIERNAVHVCAMEQSYGVHWPRSAPGVPITADCPRGFVGHSQRVCEQSAAYNSSWLLPDFSSCVRDDLLLIYNRFRALKSGFQLTNSSNILKSCFDYTIHRHKSFLPGEAAFLIDMLHELDSYLQLKGTQLEREMAAEIILHILDKVMQNAQSLNSQQQIKKLQLLTQSAALNRETIAASQLATSSGSSGGANTLQASITASSSSLSSSSVNSASSAVSASSSSSSSTSSDLSAANNVGKLQLQQRGNGGNSGSESHPAADANSILTVDEDTLSLDRLNSLRIYMTSVKTLPFNLRIYGDDLFSDQLYMDIGFSSRLLHIMANSTIFASVISYKNLKSFLPKTYYTRGSDPKDADYVLASRIIQTWLFQSNRSNDNLREPLDLPFESGHVEIIFQHETVAKDGDWVAVCGHDYKASFESSWRSDLCITKHLMDNITRCICPLSGTYVVMLTKRNHNSSQTQLPQRPLFVIVSCACCLLQSCSAFMILLPIWCNRKCAITFLKMQFCVSTSSVMLIFLLGFLKMLPVNWHAIISSSLGSLLLLGISTLIAIALVIHTELMPKKYLQISHRGATATATSVTSVGKQDFSLSETSALTEEQKRRRSTHGSNAEAGNISLTNITKISDGAATVMSSSSGGGGSTLKRQHSTTLGEAEDGRRPISLSRRQREQLLQLPSAGSGGAIGISWLLPLLFAIGAPLICSIIGKWPTNWWLEVMTTAEMDSASESSTSSSSSSSSTTSYDNIYDATHSLINGDNLLLVTTTANSNLTIDETTATSSLSSSSSLLSWTPSSSSSSAAATTSTSSSITSSTLAYSATSYPHATHFAVSTLSEAEMTHAAAYAVASASTSASASASASTSHQATNADGVSPSLSFVIFVCVDLLFILLFLALFAILMKKLLWLSHKNRNVHTHPLDKFNMALRRRLGLLYRAGSLLLIKLCTDGFFIAYVNTTQDALWSYPFGISAIVLGSTILICFVIKAECQLRGPGYNGSGSSSSGGNALKAKFSTSKASLDDNYSMNSPLNFYATQEKERENNSGAPQASNAATLHAQKQGLELSVTSTGGGSGGGVGQQLPLTIISTAPRCQMLPPGPPPSSVESFLSAASSMDRCKGDASGTFAACISDKLLLGSTATNMAVSGGSSIASPATRCCSLLSGGVGNIDGAGNTQTSLPAAAMLGGAAYYDAYAGGALTMTGSLSRRALHLQHHHQQQQQLPTEFVGLQTLDILQGVAADSSIIGIRTSNMLPPAQYHQHQQLPATLLLQHNPYVDATMLPMPPPPTLISVHGIPSSAHCGRNMQNVASMAITAGTATTTTSVTTQTPKAQKRVTIMEPTTHTFDPMMPTMSVAVAASTATLADAVTPTPPTTTTSAAATATTITAASSGTAMDNSKTTTTAKADGMLVRITHDLDYLLNRRDSPAADCDDDDEDIPPPPLPPASAATHSLGGTMDAEVRQHDVIMEENETET